MSLRTLSYALGVLALSTAGAAFGQPAKPPDGAPPQTPDTAQAPEVPRAPDAQPSGAPPSPQAPESPQVPRAPEVPPSPVPATGGAPTREAAPPPPPPFQPLTARLGDASFTLYGNLDLYFNYMYSTSGKHIFAIQDGAILRSRLGLRGDMKFGQHLKGSFALEQGINATTGAPADSTRLFDRLAWVGLSTPIGEFRVGRQNTEVFQRGGYIDYGDRTLGAVINAFGVPSRYDSDLAYIAPRKAGFLFAAHYSLQGSTVDRPTSQRVYQLALDYENGPFRIGYARVAGAPPADTPVQTEVTYDNFYGNVNYGVGKLYLVYIRSNNNGQTGDLFNGGSPLGNVGVLVTGTDPGADTTYNIYQASADYAVTPSLRVGALYGWIRDDSGTGKNASGGSIGGFYTIKNVKLLLLADVLDNDRNAGFRPIGSAGLTKPFTAGADVNGETITGVHLGVVFRF
jgi:predicted porin